MLHQPRQALASLVPDDHHRQALILLSRARERLDVFTQVAYHWVTGEILTPEPYLETLAYELDEVLFGETNRLLINMPPRHLKSFSIAVALPAFALGHNPRKKIAVVAYNEVLSREHTGMFRNLIAAPWYRSLFPDLVFTDVRIDNIRTSEGGGRRPVTIGGSFTGLGADLLILDDLIKAQDVEHAAYREGVSRFVREVALTRFNDQRTGQIILAQQRLHVDDITSELLETKQYRHLNLPSIAASDATYRRYDGRTWQVRAGGLLSPDRFPHEVLDRLRIEIGTAAFSAQYLQDPLPASSMLLDLRRMRWIEQPFERQALRYVVQSIDTAAATSDRADYSVIMTFGWNGESWCVMNVVRERIDFSRLKAVVIQQAGDWSADKVLIEGGAYGLALSSELVGRVRGRKIIQPHGSKEERLAASTEVLYTGRIHIPRNEHWSNVFRDEIRAFPGGRHDDMVDALTQFVGWQRGVRMQDLIDRREGRAPSRPRHDR